MSRSQTFPKPRVGIAGIGLIGGSLALSLKAANFATELIGWDGDRTVSDGAISYGIIARTAASFSELCASVDLLVLAAPTQACELLLQQVLAGDFSCVVTDVASVKSPLVAIAESVPDDRSTRYVPGHPIAGSERSGFSAARRDLFDAHQVILTPQEHTSEDAVALVTDAWKAAGATVHLMTALAHDEILAQTSHLPHVLAFALVDALASSENKYDVFQHAAGGFRDFTRIASSDPTMWRDISLANRDALLKAIEAFEGHFKKLKEAIDSLDGQRLQQIFSGAKSTRDAFAEEFEIRTARETREESAQS
ncbi:MAG: prephenate dehydrogenase/arogenate dehydrogenase family protein [Pseudomonadota bacterium]